MGRSHVRSKDYSQEKELLGRQKDRIDFLKENVDLFLKLEHMFARHEVLMLSFNLLKYYIVLLRQFREELTETNLQKLYPNYKWPGYVSTTKEFKELLQEVDDDLSQSLIKFGMLFDEC
jgi:hypothetical protein